MKTVSSKTWQQRLNSVLPILGHRNWIVIADAAYPWQTSPGIETICTGADHLTVVQATLKAIDRAPHIRPLVYTDAELPFLPEKDAPGITRFRTGLDKLTRRFKPQSYPHEKIIKMLDAGGKEFHILLLKTTLVLPYTSIFLQLDCGYWSVEAEARLRSSIGKRR